jgi:hypothetical protein
MGMAISFYKLLERGILSVVTLINDFSELNSSNINYVPPGFAVYYYYD